MVHKREIDQIEVADYFRKNTPFQGTGGETMNFDFLGKVYKNGRTRGLSGTQSGQSTSISNSSIKNTILIMNIYADQKNIIHLKVSFQEKKFSERCLHKSEFLKCPRIFSIL